MASWTRFTHGRGTLRGSQWLLLAVAALLLLPDVVCAQSGSFPRGPGFYYNPYKLGALTVAYLCWIRLCWWVDRDAHDVGIETNVWNPVVFGCGVLGMLVVWLLPWFWVSFCLLVALICVPGLAYTNVRNEKVPAGDRVLTMTFFNDIIEKYLNFRLGNDEGVEERGDRLAIEFIGKSDRAGDSRVARAAESKGFRGAKEMVWEAIQRRATDIHMEPTKEEMTVRYRIDGILQPADSFSRAMGDAVINIFKVLADLDITERRKPQDGSFSAEVEGRTVDFRLATAGSVVGEKMVMRILDKSKSIISLTQLGMREKLHQQISGVSDQPHGLMIVCGPTGAGKSTTLYACLNEIDRYQKNIITIENPVEYKLDNVTQIEVNPKAGKTFASELRSILRQDPDVILIGEIRDQETAEIACQAAQTGHMVFTTLHANDTITAVGRLIDLGVQPFMLASALSAVLGQRLVRILCPKCKVRYKPDAEKLRKLNLPADKIKFFYQPPKNPEEAMGEGSGDGGVCPHCGGTGYYGRTGIFELLVLTDRIRDMIRENPNLTAIKQEAVKNGMKYLQEDGLRVVIEGRTSIQELLRVAK